MRAQRSSASADSVLLRPQVSASARPSTLGLGLGLAAALVALAPSPSLAQHPTATDAPDDSYSPPVQPASDEGRDAIARFEVPEGFRTELFAAEPHLANPVCFCIDEQGRFFVAETFRHHAGVTDIREHMDWLHEDLASRTVEERVEMIRRHEGERFGEYAKEHERVRRIVDTDGDGLADESTVYADGFSHPAAGIGAGLYARRGSLWFTCIPDLWRLEDADDDGVSDAREVLQTGYGVNVSLLGHDLHGLTMGPDGRLYFSIGDRGFHVETEDGTIAHPHTGAVLRCEPDGSKLELFATGLRNPQELVFDEAGNLFTGDNNSDGGDQARWVWVLEGSDQGWRYSYQYITRPNLRGPWNAEKLWHPPHDGQPAYIVPPIANITSGPSGLTQYPGTGWGDEWNGTFFLCDFRGNPGYSGVHAFRVEPKGAGFELVDARRFLWGSLVTDVDFGYDGGLYVSDWVQGWNKTGKGRLYRLRPNEVEDAAREVGELFAAGFVGRDSAELARLLRHADKRVRLEAQWTLAERGAASLRLLGEAAADRTAGWGRLHGIWGSAQVARALGVGEGANFALEPLFALIADDDLEVRAHALRALAEGGLAGEARARAFDRLVEALGDTSPRVRLFAAQGLGALGDARAVAPLFAAVADNDDRDPWLRHACVRALERLDAAPAVFARAGDSSAAVRRASLLVMRREGSPRLTDFLADPELSLAAEAVRAIYDAPLEGQYPAVAALLDSSRSFEPTTWRRILNACRHLGGERHATRIASFATRPDVARELRVAALEILAEWAEPHPLDRVTGAWHPIEARPADFLPTLALGLEEPLLAERDGGLANAWLKLARAALDELGGREPETRAALADGVRGVLGDSGFGGNARREALRLLADGLPDWRLSLRLALEDADDEVRSAAYALLDRLDSNQAIGLLRNALQTPSVGVRQGAASALARIDGGEAEELLARALEAVAQDPTGGGHALELVEAAEKRGGDRLSRALASWRAAGTDVPAAARESDEAAAAWERFRPALFGGDPAAGRRVFFEKAETSCVRCHRIADTEGEDKTTATAGEAGPELTDVAERLERVRLLESVVFPNAAIAEGFENWIFALEGEGPYAGRIVEQDDEWIVLETTDGRVELPRDEITAERRDLSGMPQDVSTHLSRREMRDLVAFLASLRRP